MIWKSILVWLILFATFACWGYAHIRENKTLTERWRRELGDEAARKLNYFAWSRTIQLLMALGSAIIVILVYDWQLNDARKVINELSEISPVATVQTTTEPAPPPPPASIVPPALPVQNTPAAAPVVLTPPPNVPNTNALVEEVYAPERQANDQQSVLDQMKKRYEDILVIYFFLKKCNRINAADYHVIISALSQEMASANAPGRLQNDILTAAQGSYKEMYEQSDCADKNTDTLYTQYVSYINTLSKQYTVP